MVAKCAVYWDKWGGGSGGTEVAMKQIRNLTEHDIIINCRFDFLVILLRI